MISNYKSTVHAAASSQLISDAAICFQNMDRSLHFRKPGLILQLQVLQVTGSRRRSGLLVFKVNALLLQLPLV